MSKEYIPRNDYIDRIRPFIGLEIGDNYPKYVVSMDEFAVGNYQGIKHWHLRDFLVAKSFT